MLQLPGWGLTPHPGKQNGGTGVGMDVQLLSSPIRIGNKLAPNRIVIHPVEGNNGDSSGNPTERTIERYRKLAEGGAGVIFSEALTISYTSRARKNQLLIAEKTAKGLERLVKAVREVNGKSLFLFQLDHAGRLGDALLSKVVSIYQTGEPRIHVLTEDEIEEIGSTFVKAAVIASHAGVDGIDIKHAHGFLCGEMLRPANARADRFGGSFENRTRFVREMARKMRAAVGDSFLLGVRVSAYEGIPGGLGTAGPAEVIEDLRELIALSKMIEEIGMNYVSVSAGSADANLEILLPTDKYPEGTFRHFGWTKAVKRAVGIPVIGSGYSYLRDGKNNLKEPDPSRKSFIYWAEKNLRDGNVDLVGIGRQSLADPLFPKKILSDEIHLVNFCTACGGCGILLGAQEEAGCTVYDDYYGKLLRRIKKRSKT